MVPSRLRIETDPAKALPLTTSFLSQSRPNVLPAAARNAATATTASALLNRIDDLLTAHTDSARSLRQQLSSLPAVTKSVVEAEQKTRSIVEQLQSLDRLVTEIVAEDARNSAAEEAAALQRAEDERFEAYAKQKRRELAEVKEEYYKKLLEFRKERVEVQLEVGSAFDGRRGCGNTQDGPSIEEVDVVGSGVNDTTGKKNRGRSGDALEGFFSDEEDGEEKSVSPAPPTPTGTAPTASSPPQPLSPPPPRPKGKQRHGLLAVGKAKAKAKPAPATVSQPKPKKRANQMVIMDEDVVDEEELKAFYR